MLTAVTDEFVHIYKFESPLVLELAETSRCWMSVQLIQALTLQCRTSVIAIMQRDSQHTCQVWVWHLSAFLMQLFFKFQCPAPHTGHTSGTERLICNFIITLQAESEVLKYRHFSANYITIQ